MMKKQLIMITSTIILSSSILGSLRIVTDQGSTFGFESSPAAPVTESEQFTENQDNLSLTDHQLSGMAVGKQTQNIAKLIKSIERNEGSNSDRGVENATDEDDSNQEIVSIQSPTSGDIRLDEGFITRIPMEDQYHSQISETSLPNACGPTALMMALDYFELEQSLAEVIQKLQYSPAQGGYDPYCTANPICTSPGALVRVAREEYGLLVDAHEGWTFDEIQQSLAAGQPIIADIVWHLADEGPGHFVVIYGIDTKQEILFYHDPYDGAERVASWEEFSVAWDGPVDQGDPIQPQGYAFWGMSLTTE
jgi:uncharacterized protein YvpB